ncbi:hypothetical protein GE061_004344 [Apolygus lucorum]|uniref:Tetraspanin n=1 Tax=Apolygus lucorum TaxID=248454 RepID=A0A8S9X0Q3_APOLU|nr:hypothetical protein GE061_004344 [Apolygus lucorum]
MAFALTAPEVPTSYGYDRIAKNFILATCAMAATTIGLGTLGCLTIHRQTKILAIVYSICLGVSATVFFVLGTLSFMIDSKFTRTVHRSLKMALFNETNFIQQRTLNRSDLNKIEQQNACCGVSGHLKVYVDDKFPVSCCKKSVVEGSEMCSKETAYQIACDVMLTGPLHNVLIGTGMMLVILAIYLVFVTAASLYEITAIVKGKSGYISEDRSVSDKNVEKMKAVTDQGQRIDSGSKPGRMASVGSNPFQKLGEGSNQGRKMSVSSNQGRNVSIEAKQRNSRKQPKTET